jgi:protein TonB
MRLNHSITILAIVVIGHSLAVYGMAQLSETAKLPTPDPVIEAIVLPPPPKIEPPVEPKKIEKPKPKKVVQKPKPQLPPPPAPPVPNENSVQTPALPANTDTDPNGTGTEPVEKEAAITLPTADSKRPNKAPVYPKQSRKNNEEGTVILELLITPEGKVKSVRLKESCGFEKLDKAAIKAAKKWRFNPALSDGKPISFWHTQPIQFVMN